MSTEIGKAYVQIIPSAVGISDSISKELSIEADKAEKRTSKLGGSLKSMGKTIAVGAAAAMATVGTAAVVTGKKLYSMANNTAALGDRVDKMSQKLGLSRQAYQEWDYVLSQSGMNIDQMQAGIKTLTNTIDGANNGTDEAVKKFAKLGITQADLAKKSREDIFALTISRLQDMGDETEKAALANQLFGRSGSELMPLLNSTSASTQDLIKKARDLGLVMSDDAVAAAAAYTDSMDTLNRTFTAVKNRIASDMMPGITMISDGLTGLIAGQEGASEMIRAGTVQIVESISQTLPQIVDVLFTIITSIAEVAPDIIKTLVKGVVDNLPQLLEAAAAIVTSLVSALLEALPEIARVGFEFIGTLAQGLSESLPEMVPSIVDIGLTLIDTLLENIPLLIDVALQLITGLAEGLVAAIPVIVEKIPTLIESLINAILGSIPQIIEAGVQLLTSLVSNLPQIILTIVQALPQIITGIINALVNNFPLIVQAGVDLFTSIIKNLPQIIWQIIQAIPQIISAIVGGFGALMGQIINIGGDIARGIWQGIQNLAGWLWNKVKGWASSIWQGVKNFFGIRSPSTLFEDLGEELPAGFAEGVLGNAGVVTKAMDKMGALATRSFETEVALNAASSYSASGYNAAVSSSFVEPATVDKAVPANVTFVIGGHAFKAFVEDITKLQDRTVELVLAY